ncbi:hypothetical protein JCM10213_002038 [Rhodosporidiobolus nylandii]
MVRLPSLLALSAPLLLAPAVSAGPLEALAAVQDAASGVVKLGMKRVLGFNDTQIERVMQTEAKKLEPHPYAVDLTDENWETVLATGTDNPFAQPLAEDTVWVITVFGPDAISKPFVEGMNEVALHNSSAAGGSVPENVRFARLSYAKETILPTKWWLWRVPVIVVGTDRMQTLRFIRPGQVRPYPEDLALVFSQPELWQKADVWKGAFAPGEKLEPLLHRMALYWSKFHNASSQVPHFVLLALSGFLMNFVLSYFHSSEKKPQTQRAAAGGASSASPAAPSTASTSATKGKKAAAKRK